MPVVETGQDNTADQGVVDDQAKFDQARADLYDEATGGQPPAQQQEEEESLILGKYKSQDDLIDAYKNLQRENQRLRGGESEEEPEPSQPPSAEETSRRLLSVCQKRQPLASVTTSSSRLVVQRSIKLCLVGLVRTCRKNVSMRSTSAINNLTRERSSLNS